MSDHGGALGSPVTRFRLPPIESVPLRVLIRDEDRDVARTLARTVERLPGVEAVVATSADEALAMAEEGAFDLALVDLGVESRGVDLLLALRDASPATMRVLLSAHPDESLALGGAVYTEAQAYVLKPWDTRLLLRTLDKLLRRRAVRVASGAILN